MLLCWKKYLTDKTAFSESTHQFSCEICRTKHELPNKIIHKFVQHCKGITFHWLWKHMSSYAYWQSLQLQKLLNKDWSPLTFKSGIYCHQISLTKVSRICCFAFETFLWCLSVKKSQQFLQCLQVSIFFQEHLKEKQSPESLCGKIARFFFVIC